MEKTIRSLSDVNSEVRKQGYRNWIQWSLIRRGFELRPDWEHPKGKLSACVSKGRWYVKCPCSVAQGINEKEALHFCIDCLNVENDFKPYRVEWKSINKLNELLRKRIDYRQRNYNPNLGETHKHLAEENKKLVNGVYHGV